MQKEVMIGMKGLLLVNGEYGDLTWYSARKHNYKYVYCTDGAASKARDLCVIPKGVVGDMDSIVEEDLIFMFEKKVEVYKFPPEKDYTDTYLALKLMEDKGFKEVVVWGATGGRLDHTIANIMAAAFYVKGSMEIAFEEPGLTIDIIRREKELKGERGDVVSIFPIGGEVKGVSLTGFKYPLSNAVLSSDSPIGISNVLQENRGIISVENGVLAVFHYCR